MIFRTIRIGLKELKECLSYQYGWDGYNGEKFDIRKVSQAEEFILMANAFFNDVGIRPKVEVGLGNDGIVEVGIRVRKREIAIIFDEEVRVYSGEGGNGYEEIVSGDKIYGYLGWVVGDG